MRVRLHETDLAGKHRRIEQAFQERVPPEDGHLAGAVADEGGLEARPAYRLDGRDGIRSRLEGSGPVIIAQAGGFIELGFGDRHAERIGDKNEGGALVRVEAHEAVP